MHRGFRRRRGLNAKRWLIVVALLGILLLIYELYDVIVPFKAQNPLWKEVTVGEPVINGWMYDGEDEEGYLKFYNQSGVTHVLPPDSHLISLDGEFVIIEDYSTGTLTYALPMEAISLPWLIGGAVVIVGGIFVFSRRLKTVRRPLNRLGGRQFRAKRISVSTRNTLSRSKRFRAKARGKSRFL